MYEDLTKRVGGIWPIAGSLLVIDLNTREVLKNAREYKITVVNDVMMIHEGA